MKKIPEKQRVIGYALMQRVAELEEVLTAASRALAQRQAQLAWLTQAVASAGASVNWDTGEVLDDVGHVPASNVIN